MLQAARIDRLRVVQHGMVNRASAQYPKFIPGMPSSLNQLRSVPIGVSL